MKRIAFLVMFVALLAPSKVFAQAPVDDFAKLVLRPYIASSLSDQLLTSKVTIDWATADVKQFSLIAAGGGYTTYFTFVNDTAVETQVAVSVMRQDGWPLEGTIHDVLYTGPASGFTAVLPKHSSRQIAFTMSGGQVAGHTLARIPTGSGAKVSLSYEYAPEGSVLGQATVVSTHPTTAFSLFAQHSSGLGQDSKETGISLVNPGPVASNVELKLTGVSGEDLGSCNPFLIEPYTQVVGFVKDLCRLSNPYRGLARGSSSLPLVVGALQTTTSFKTGGFSFSLEEVVLP